MAPANDAPARARGLSYHTFDIVVFVAGLAILVTQATTLLGSGWSVPWPHLLTIPLIVLIARFPLVLDSKEGGIEVGFDSCVLIFLLCTLPPSEAVMLWSLGVVAAQLTNDKLPDSKRFNIGIGIIGGAAASLTITSVRGDALGSLRELVAVGLAAACYFAIDYVVTAVSIALEEQTPLRKQLQHPGTALAVACFVPFDSLGYLGAVVSRSGPWWMIGLLAVPLVTMLIATRAVTRGREHARRLGVLFEAAVRTQGLTETRQVAEALVEDARRLLQLSSVNLRPLPPDSDQIGVELQDGHRNQWIVAPLRNRARSSSAADRQALEALGAVASDAFSRLRLSDEMTHLARHDVLTNLPNRALLLDRVEHALRGSRRHGRRIALLFCDLDGFKQVNDRFGHAAGDAVLVDIAQRLISCVRDTDTVARLGGDEFAVLLEDVVPDQVDAACERILTALRPSANVAGRQVALSASIGVALGDTGRSAEHLLRNADMAMYEAKSLGKDRWVRYQQALGRSRVRHLELVEALRAAVDNGELRLAYQPVVQLDTGRIIGVEALSRWTSGGVPVPPEVFIGAAEESGLVVALGDLVFDLVANDAPLLRAAAESPLSVGVNISAQQLREPTFVAKVEQTMHRMEGVDLILEITERDWIDNDSVAVDTMTQLSEQGVPFAIDDFGVGFSSIGYLQHMPVRILKIDRSFLVDIDVEERACRLLRSIMMMGQALGLDVVAEGLERASQLEHLRDHIGGDVDTTFAQGYLLHRPMPLAEVVEVIRANREVQDLALPPPERTPA